MIKTTAERGDVFKRLKIEFGDLRVIEAKTALRIQPLPCDVEGATIKDPANCVFARAARRQFGATKVLFWKTAAYVDLIDEDGVRHIEHFTVTKVCRRLIESFDRGTPIEEGRAFQLRPPSKSRWLDVQAKEHAAHERTPNGRIIRLARNAKRDRGIAEARLERANEILREMRATQKPHSPKVALALKQLQTAQQAVEVAKEKEVQAVTHARRRGKMLVRRVTAITTGRTVRKIDLTVRDGIGKYRFVERRSA